MYKFNMNSPGCPSIQKTNLSYYNCSGITGADGILHVFFDDAQDFSANLDIMAYPETISLNFQYHPKNDNGSVLILGIASSGKNSLEVHCINSTTKAYKCFTIVGCEEENQKLLNIINQICKYRLQAQKYIDDDSVILQIKTLLNKFTNITRAFLRIDILKNNHHPMKVINDTLEEEVQTFKNILVRNEDFSIKLGI